ncbi:hypothetical protein IU459_13345 [Nocardia amamiensis]|uniref:Lipoprotein n=1 Tax=Nocardia amamiensis TaxID=404578 RepID=A0ABS0CPI5_9NOCA|nr:hypothetical protein [Nocardia amamiensis]MBF6298519.1 hypothetical protein [Nocardia amamiensis]
MAVTGCLLASAACSPSDDRNEAAAQCAATFDLKSRAEPLGSSDELERVIRKLAAQPGTYSLRTLTEAAGWAGQWDRLVMASSGMPAERLSSVAGTPGYCWSNLPSFKFDYTVHNFYIFVAGSTPIQAIHNLQGSELFRRVHSGDVLQPDSSFQSVQPPGHLGQPYLELAQG